MPSKLLPLLSTMLLYALYCLICTFKFDMQILSVAVPYDFLLQLGIAYILFALPSKVEDGACLRQHGVGTDGVSCDYH